MHDQRAQLNSLGFQRLAESINESERAKNEEGAVILLIAYASLIVAGVLLLMLLGFYVSGAWAAAARFVTIPVIVGGAVQLRREFRRQESLRWEWALAGKRKPVVYLRRFAWDRAVAGSAQDPLSPRLRGSEKTFERQLIDGFSPVGPIICLSSSEFVATAHGAARLFATDESWQTAVRELVDASIGSFLVYSPSQSMDWELNQILNSSNHAAFVFLPDGDDALPEVLVAEFQKRGISQTTTNREFGDSRLFASYGERCVIMNTEPNDVRYAVRLCISRLGLKSMQGPNSYLRNRAQKAARILFSWQADTVVTIAVFAAFLAGIFLRLFEQFK